MGKIIYVGELGKCLITNKKTGIDVTYVEEEDGEKNWYVHPDENSDVWLKSAKVIPLEKERFPDNAKKQGWYKDYLRHSKAYYKGKRNKLKK